MSDQPTVMIDTPEYPNLNHVTVKMIDATAKLITPRGIAKAVVGSSVRFVVSGTITALVPVDSRKDRVKVWIGSHMIAAVVNDKAKAIVDRTFDEWFGPEPTVIEEPTEEPTETP